LLYGAAFAFDRGTFHGYYLAVIAAPIAILAAVGIVAVGRALKLHRPWPVLVIVIAVAWELYIQSEAHGRLPWIGFTLVVGTILGTAMTFIRLRRSAGVGFAVAMMSLSIAPASWALTSVWVKRVNTLTPAADLLRFTHEVRDPIELASSGYGVATDDERLFEFLAQHRHGERFVMATPNARLAAPIIIHTGEAVMAIGGFSGEDPGVMPEDLRRLADSKTVRYILLGDDLAFGTQPKDRERAQQFLAQAEQIGRLVPRPEWRTPRISLADLLSSGAPLRLQGARMQLYDLRPNDRQGHD
jgi:4-amino-4-deoxy-L-arabinose transferase-like glycosyltransferase